MAAAVVLHVPTGRKVRLAAAADVPQLRAAHCFHLCLLDLLIRKLSSQQQGITKSGAEASLKVQRRRQRQNLLISPVLEPHSQHSSLHWILDSEGKATPAHMCARVVCFCC